MKKTAIILLNLGGPLSLKEVKPFLSSLFYDPAIISLPNPLRYFLSQFLARKRLKEAQHIYSLLGGGSPLLENTKAQAVALASHLGGEYKVFVAMRHATPLTQDIVEDVKAYDPQEIVLLPLYPQYSTTTTESSFKAWKDATKGWNIPTSFIYFYPTESGFIKALKELTLQGYQEAQKYGHPRVLMTAHGLPEKIIRKGDPYQRQVEETAQALVKKLGISFLDYVLCYQSRVGPLRWIGPYTDEEILIASRKKRPLVIVPLSFVSEHSETLVELDITYRELALQEGCPFYKRVNTVQTHPAFIKGLVNLVEKRNAF